MRRALRRFDPELVLIHNEDVSVEAFDTLGSGVRKVMFVDDCWRSPVLPEHLGLAARVDLLLAVAAGQIPEFLDAGVAEAAWIAESHDPEMHHPVSEAGPEWRSDVAFIGKNFARSVSETPRTELVHAVWEKFETKLYGAGWDRLGMPSQRREVLPRHYRLVCNGAKIVLGRDWCTDCEWYFSNRTWFRRPVWATRANSHGRDPRSRIVDGSTRNSVTISPSGGPTAPPNSSRTSPTASASPARRAETWPIPSNAASQPSSPLTLPGTRG